MRSSSILRFVTSADLEPGHDPKTAVTRRLYQGVKGRVLDVGNPGTRHTGCDLAEGHDWRTFPLDTYDTIVADDLFPNVDQGLDEFLTRWMPHTTEIRLSLTVYSDKWYRARRVDGDEILTMVAWDWYRTAEVLERHGFAAAYVAPPDESLFPNGRQVCLLIS